MFNGMYGIGQQSELPQSGQFGYGMENQAGHQPTYSEKDPYPDKTSSRTLIA